MKVSRLAALLLAALPSAALAEDVGTPAKPALRISDYRCSATAKGVTVTGTVRNATAEPLRNVQVTVYVTAPKTPRFTPVKTTLKSLPVNAALPFKLEGKGNAAKAACTLAFTTSGGANIFAGLGD